jgi:hypothetical protein
MTRSSTLAISLGTLGTLALVAACGGKILDDGSVTAISGGPGTSPTGSAGGGPGATTGNAPSSPTGGPSSGPGTGPTPTPSTKPIACGGGSCDGATQECCITVGGGPGGGGSTSSAGGPPSDPTMATCTPKGKCGGDIALSCSSAASCVSGQVCCADLSADAPAATCQPSCARGDAQLCVSDKDCPMGRTCQDTQVGFKFCRRGGGGGGGGGASSNGGP